MKKYIYILTFGTMAFWQAFAGNIIVGLPDNEKEIQTNEWSALIDNTQISIGLKNDEKVFKTNQIIEVLVRIKNLSTNETYNVYVQRMFTNNEDFSFVVISPSGKDISPLFHRTPIGSGGFVSVPPNQINGFQFDLNEICKTDEVGTYKIILKMHRWSPNKHQSFEIVSKPLFVSVVPSQ
jgi:hypothetical protein